MCKAGAGHARCRHRPGALGRRWFLWILPAPAAPCSRRRGQKGQRAAGKETSPANEAQALSIPAAPACVAQQRLDYGDPTLAMHPHLARCSILAIWRAQASMSTHSLRVVVVLRPCSLKKSTSENWRLQPISIPAAGLSPLSQANQDCRPVARTFNATDSGNNSLELLETDTSHLATRRNGLVSRHVFCYLTLLCHLIHVVAERL